MEETMREKGIVANKLLLLGAITLVLTVSACQQTPQGDSIVKVESGNKTIVDVKQDSDENLDIKIGVPKFNKAGSDIPPDTTYDY
jgi:hypothetical protein